MPPSILVADKLEDFAIEGLRSLGCAVTLDPDCSAEQLPAKVSDLKPAVIIVRSTKVTADAIRSGGDYLKAVIRAGAGYDNVDTAAATAAGIAVCNCPGMNAVAVAELVMALLLTCDRDIPDQVIAARKGLWEKKHFATKGIGLKGRTLGVVGVGAIGRAVIQRARAFEMNIIAHSINMTEQRAADLGVGFGGSTRQHLYDMLRHCDAVSIHVSGNPESKDLCDAAFFSAMKPGAIFINTSRGSVLDEPALAAAARDKGIRAGLDVYRDEPAAGNADWKFPFSDTPGVYGTHHVGASTEQAQLAVAEEVVRIVKVSIEANRWENKVN